MKKFRKKTVLSIIITYLLTLGITVLAENKDVLRIGTTGDYSPVSFYNQSTKEFSGFDIDMAKNLASYLNKKAVFIKTTWSTMSNDLLDKKFDIAMGGITKTKKRGELFLLSNYVIETGKVPLIRKDDVNKFKTLSDIDEPNITVVENLGGTNAQFAKTLLRHAKIIIVPHNEEAFQYLIKKKADVMFTDVLEAQYREKIDPTLLAIWTNNQLNKSYKVYMVNKDNASLLKEVNTWLNLCKETGILSYYLNNSFNSKY